MKAAADFLPDGPSALSSEDWKRDYNLTRRYGGATSTLRSAAETEIGVFWTEYTGQQYARTFNNLVATYNLGVEDSARMMAMLWTGYADAAIRCFNATWMPLGTTPAHPVFWARIYVGFHFYHSLQAGSQLGRSVAGQVVKNHFRAITPR